MMIGTDIPDEITYKIHDDRVKFILDDLSTGWMDQDDSFIERIDTSLINPKFTKEHLTCEITMKNLLDEAEALTESEKYTKAIELLDEILYYDEEYEDALILKSHALRGQKHFVKALRYYRRAVKTGFIDEDYYKVLLSEANSERDTFPKLKLNIYAGDEFFTKNEFGDAVEAYNRALANPSKFRDRILFKLLNKKATALYNLGKFGEALECFRKSLEIKSNDYAYYGCGCCEFELDLDINDRFKTPLKVNKQQSLNQVLILNEAEFFEESLVICDMLFKVHYVPDVFYLKMISAKLYALDRLGRDLSEAREIFKIFN